MAAMRYPIGIQTFSWIIENGYRYVDKTHFIPQLIDQGKYVFLSRPRRFGKSLLLSTLEAFFEGRRDLFKGLAIDSMEINWASFPVLHIDLNNGLYDTPEGLVTKLHDSLEVLESQYGIPQKPKVRNELPIRFQRLIKKVYDTTGSEVVILIDEYDKPLLDIEEDMAVFEQHQRLLKGFFSNLKAMDKYIRFAFITGVARFNKVSIFSDFNNLDDISLEHAFANICGWTEQELLHNFRPGIEALAEDRNESFDKTLEALRFYYDGYMFTERGSRLYNPYSVLRALKAKSIDPYWFETGTPTFLVKRIKRMGLYPPDINGEMCPKVDLVSVGLNDHNPVPLMFQTGYLTISSYNNEMQMYELRFPNREVEIGFSKLRRTL